MARSITAAVGLVGCLAAGLAIDIGAQSAPPKNANERPAIGPADYGQWETLQTIPARGGLSPDGRWLAYGINRSNRKNELRIANVADGTTKTAAFGAQPVFSANSRWVVYSIGVSEAQEEKLRKDKEPVHKKLGLIDLQTGETTTVDGIESFAFD